MNSTPALIVIGGFAGAGKTTITAKLAHDYNIAVFSSDTINDAMRNALGMSFKEVSPAAYVVLWQLVKRQLQLGVTVIVDAHMSAAHTWESLDCLNKEMPNIRVLPIILQATLETHRARIEERGRTNKQHLNLGGDKLEDVMFKYDFIQSLKRTDLVRVDANGSVDHVYSLVCSVLSEQLRISA